MLLLEQLLSIGILKLNSIIKRRLAVLRLDRLVSSIIKKQLYHLSPGTGISDDRGIYRRAWAYRL